MKKILVICCFVLLSACQSNEEEKFLGIINYADDEKCHISLKNERTEPVIHTLLNMGTYDENIDSSTITSEIKNAILRGCNVNETDSNGLYPLNLAVIGMDDTHIKVLLEHGANPNLKMSGSKDFLEGKDLFQFSEILLQEDFSEKRKLTNQLVQSYR